LLARLGVDEIHFIDNDSYDPSNLTRQLLGSIVTNDIGKRKVEISARNLEFHNLRSKLYGYETNALTEWPKVVEIASKCHVLFNCIDVGTVFDYAVNSLSKALGIPLVQGQSAGWSFNAEMYSGQPGCVCSACFQSIKSSFSCSGRELESITSRLHDWCQMSTLFEEDYDKTSQDKEFLTDQHLFDFLANDKQYRIHGTTAMDIIRICIGLLQSVSSRDCNDPLQLQSLSIIPNNNGKISLRSFPKFLQYYYEVSEVYLSPKKILELKDLDFIPKPSHVPTRYVGSWVCPCVGVATIMVSQYANFITVC
jgi:molybdopterin/thiamine biosynthesis adenylyltransferase